MQVETEAGLLVGAEEGATSREGGEVKKRQEQRHPARQYVDLPRGVGQKWETGRQTRRTKGDAPPTLSKHLQRPLGGTRGVKTQTSAESSHVCGKSWSE